MATDGDSNITVVGGNVSNLNERVAGTADMVQGTAGNRPQYVASGGPNDLPYCTTQDANRVLSASIAIAAGNRACMYVVAAAGANNGFITFYMTHTGGHGGTQSRLIPNATQFVARGEFTAGTQTITVTSIAKDTNFHLFAWRPLATGALFQIDGTTTTADFTGSDTLLQVTGFNFGFGGGLSDSGAKFYSCFIVDNADSSKDTIVKTYVNQVTGLTLA